MRTYEALYIVHPNSTDEQTQTIVKEVEGLVTGSGGAIVRSEIWGKRRLAYEVKHCNEGIYVLLRFEAGMEFPARLETHFQISETVIRHLLVHFDEHTLALEIEQAALKQLQLERASRSPRDDSDNDDDD